MIIDICCYRRLGHNEADEPSVTNPAMYEVIKKHPTTMTLFAQRLIEEKVITEEAFKDAQQAYRDGLDKGENTARKTLGLVGNKYTVNWSRYSKDTWDAKVDTAVSKRMLQGLAKQLTALPEDFTLHNRVSKIYDDRVKMAAGEMPMDWGFAETMAYATLLSEGFAVRLCGQDTRRGTFFHRHASVYDSKTGQRVTPLATLSGQEGRFEVNDTLLSEVGVLGFEYGYSTTDPATLVIWEAQFGDFANGAQVLFDQFIASGSAKWGRLCGLTVFLPHGFEGQGPEHSSARLERFLQLCAADNQQVCVPSTPAQMFHMLRRQMKRNNRMPLVVMTPKSLLRHPQSVSSLEDLTNGRFQCVIDDASVDPKKVKRVVLCSGKVYYDLLKGREEAGLSTVALVRVEQLYPFPREDYEAVLQRYKGAKEIVWCQEEPENQGAWYQIKHRLSYYLGASHRLLYATRKGSASTAVGYLKIHNQEQQAVVEAGLRGGEPV